MHKQQYKGFTLFVNDTHLGIRFVTEGNEKLSEYKVPLQEDSSLEDHISFLKRRIDMNTKR